MSQSLRKACHACAQSKRRCVPRLPRCDRCAKKQIPCHYDLEPVSQGQVPPEREQDSARSGTRDADNASAEQDLQIVYSSVMSAREASIDAMASGYSPDSAATHPKMVGTPLLTAWVLNFFAKVVKDASTGKGTPFCHPRILHAEVQQTGLDTKHDHFHRVLQIHQLTIQSLTMLLDKSANKVGEPLEDVVAKTFSATHEIWSSPPHDFDPSVTPWEMWVLAESIRRSMFVATIVKGLLSFVRTGMVTYEPFFESCPFDPRAGLWEAATAEEWHAAVWRHGRDHVKLKSYHEFIEGSQSAAGTGLRLDPNEDGVFQRFIFVCYHSDTGIQYIEQLDGST